MGKITPFDVHADRYEAWFVEHPLVYASELLAVRALIPWQGDAVEIGVGTGRFAAPLGVQIGVDPSCAMLGYALARGIQVVQGCGEALPFRDAAFDYALVVTTLCFASDVCRLLAETHRVLRKRGHLVVGFIDRASTLGREYTSRQEEDVFYCAATFYSAAEVQRLLTEAGFRRPLWVQTLSSPLPQVTQIEPIRPGYGEGAFVVVCVGK